MDQKLTQILLFFGLCIPSSYHIRYFHYVNLIMNWTDAQNYCRETYTDLATIDSVEDINRLNRPPLSTTTAWIGLRDDPEAWKGTLKNYPNSWRWSATGQTSKTGYEVWHTGEPDNFGGTEFCVMMNYDGTWSDVSCVFLNPFVCYTEATNAYVYVSLFLTWLDAQAHCRAYYTDLVTIESSVENTKVLQTKPAFTLAWIGLYRVPWTWSDNSNSLFRNWLFGEPNNADFNDFCACEYSQHQWADADCYLMKAFICEEDSSDEVVHTSVVKIKLQTDTHMTDPIIYTQVLQQLSAKLASEKPADIKLQWKIQPRKQETVSLTGP